MLKEFGFSQYESKVYEVLVSSETALDTTMIVKYSGVPKTKIYEVLSRMIDKGMIMEAVSEKKKMYTALPLDLAVERLTAEFEANIRSFKEKTTKKTFSDDKVWTFKMQASIVAQNKELIRNAKQSIRISAWNDNFLEYVPLLEEKEKQGLDVKAHVVGETHAGIKNLHFFIPTEEDVFLERFQLLVVDDKEIIFATAEEDAWQAIRTKSLPFVKVFSEFFFHDVVLTAIMDKYQHLLMKDPEIKQIVNRLRF